MAASPYQSPLRIVVLLSGSGSTLDNLATRIADGRLPEVEIGLVISSRRDVAGCDVARRHGLPLLVLRRCDFANDDSYSAALTAAVRDAAADIAVMAGFLCFWRIPAEFERRVMNIHPSLLPAFGGRGMFGRNVHAAVLASGAAESGCTVHIADNEYDHGPILAQRRVPVLAGDTPETLAARVSEQERELYPAVLSEVVRSRAAGAARDLLRISRLCTSPAGQPGRVTQAG